MHGYQSYKWFMFNIESHFAAKTYSFDKFIIEWQEMKKKLTLFQCTHHIKLRNSIVSQNRSLTFGGGVLNTFNT